MERSKGVVAWFNIAKGFGFIKQVDAPDLFCHYSAIRSDGFKSLKEGDSVTFDVETDGEGKHQAANVEKTASRTIAI